MNWVLIGLAVILLFILLLFLKIKIKIDVLHTEDNNHIKITIKALYGLISYTYNVPFINFDKDSASLEIETKQNIGNNKNKPLLSKDKQKITPNEIINNVKKAKQFLEKVIHLHVIVKKFMRHISVHKLEWKSLVGLGDAAHTGIAVGTIWALKGGIIGIVSKYMKLMSTPNVMVTPYFQENLLQTRFECMISFRIGYAIVAALSVVKYWRNTKGGSQLVRTSNSRLNDNSYGKLEAND